MAKSVASFLTIVSFSLFEVGSGNAFLRIKPNSESGQVNSDNIERTLLEEIEGQVGNANIRGRLARLESALHPMFLSLPKNEHGNLDHGTVRYALHRLFVQRHGWYIKGLDNAGQSWNESSHANILKDQAADFVQSVFEHRLGDRGLNLHELAVLGATLEHLIHDESEERLNKAYVVTRHDTNASMTFEQASEITYAYMKLFILGDEIGTTTSNARMNQIYPGWTDTKEFARAILKDTTNEQRREGARDPWSNLDFNVVSKSVEEIAEQYGRFQDGECRAMKTDLINLGDRNIGRVPLSNFYKPALEGKSWQFMESVDYLRSLGALDETDPNLPSVIVPNYIGSQSNCVVSTSYYSVCCIDECEGLTSQLEKEFQSPEADPKEVMAVVAGMSSSTVTGPRELSAPLVRRLEDIAEGHHGTVPLHGRLFAQWMHHAFPRECPFPHVAGTTNPQAASEWIEQAGTARATQKEMQKVSAAIAAAGGIPEDEELTHWTHEEELLVPRAAPRRAGSSLWGGLRNVMFLSALVAVGVRAVSTTGKASTTLYGGCDGKADKLV
jgi:hypothetical protein